MSSEVVSPQTHVEKKKEKKKRHSHESAEKSSTKRKHDARAEDEIAERSSKKRKHDAPTEDEPGETNSHKKKRKKEKRDKDKVKVDSTIGDDEAKRSSKRSHYDSQPQDQSMRETSLENGNTGHDEDASTRKVSSKKTKKKHGAETHTEESPLKERSKKKKSDKSRDDQSLIDTELFEKQSKKKNHKTLSQDGDHRDNNTIDATKNGYDEATALENSLGDGAATELPGEPQRNKKKKNKNRDSHAGEEGSEGLKNRRREEETERGKESSKKRKRKENQPDELIPKKSKKRKSGAPENEDSQAGTQEHTGAIMGSDIPVQEWLSQRPSPFQIQTTSFYLPLSPIAQSTPLEGLCAEHFSPLLLTYYPPLRGVVLAYENPRLSNSPGKEEPDADGGVYGHAINEYAVSYVWLTADFILLDIGPTSNLVGHVSIQHKDYLGLICYNQFNATINSKRLPSDWTWRAGPAKQAKPNQSTTPDDFDGPGRWIDSKGDAVHGLVAFTVVDFESSPSFGKDKGFLSIEGTMGSNDGDSTL